jgi:hypothetical protein
MDAMKALLLAVTFAASILSCDGATAPSVPIDRDFTLAPGDRATVATTGVRIRFLRVEGDSRCPADAVCIQGGDALVKIEVQSSSGTEPFDLHTGSMAPVTSRNLTLALVSLTPYPFSSRTIKPEEYRATLRVTQK